MMPSVQEFADRWGVEHSRIIALRNQGMPMESFEAADAWRATRQGAVTHLQKAALAGAIEGAATGSAPAGQPVQRDELEGELESQRQTVKIARAQYHRAMRDPARQKEVPKLYVVLNKAIDQLFKTKKELLAHQLATRQLINSQNALERFRKVLGLVVQEWEQSEVALAARANPGNKALALKVFREWREERLKRIYAQANAAVLSLTGEELGNPTVIPIDPVTDTSLDEDPEAEPGEAEPQ